MSNKRPSRYSARMELRRHVPRELHGLIHRASVSTYSTYKSTRRRRLRLTPAQECQIDGFISVEDFWRVVGGKVRDEDVRGLLRQRSLFP